MSTRIERESTITSAKDIAQRVKTIEWERVSQDLDAQGSAIVKRLITPAECDGLAQLYLEDGIFRSRVVMAQHGFTEMGGGRTCHGRWTPLVPKGFAAAASPPNAV